MRHHRLTFPTPRPSADDPVLAVSITGQDAPMRTVFYQDHSQLTPPASTPMTTYRTIVMVEVAEDRSETTKQGCAMRQNTMKAVKFNNKGGNIRVAPQQNGDVIISRSH